MVDMRVIAETWMSGNALLPIFDAFVTSRGGAKKSLPIVSAFTGLMSVIWNAALAIPPSR